MNDIEIFLNKRNHTPKSDKVSVLEPFKDEIFQLKNMGYAEKIIVEFLSEMKGVKISRQALNLFIRSRSPQMQNVPPQTVVEPPKPIVHQKEKAVFPPNAPAPENTPSTQTSEVSAEQEKPTPTDKPKLKKGIKKFDWKNATSDGLV